MNRRTVLTCAFAGLGGGLIGCLDDGTPVGDDTSGTDIPSNDDANTDMRLSLTGVDDGPGPLSFDIDVVENQLTSSTMPLLDISVENTGDDRATWLHAPAVGEDEIVFPCQRATPDKLTVGFEAEVLRLLIANDAQRARFGDIVGNHHETMTLSL